MILQACFDESLGPDGVLAIGGLIGTEKQWVGLAKEWEELLPRFGRLGPADEYHFKARVMLNSKERKKDIAPFYRLIEKYTVLALGVAIRPADFERAKSRIVLMPPYQYVCTDTTFQHAFRVLFKLYLDNRDKIFQIAEYKDSKVEFIFDERSDSKSLLMDWYRNQEEFPNIMQELGSTPTFRDDKDFLPLQAADFIVSIIRHKANILFNKEELLPFDIGFSSKRELPLFIGTIEEHNIIESMCGMIYKSTNESVLIFIASEDGTKFSPWVPPEHR